jgi:hypothetical protein
MTIKVNWEQTKGNHFQPQAGTDEAGNQYMMSANQEVVTVLCIDGSTGQGWTAEDAFHNAHLEDCKRSGVPVLKAPPDLDAAGLTYWLNRAQAISNEFCQGQPISIATSK